MYHIYVNYQNEVIEEYDSMIAYNIIYHLHACGMLLYANYTDMYGKIFSVVI